MRFFLLAALIAAPVLASPGPQPAPMPPPIPVAADTPYPGVIRLDVDARDTTRRIVHVRETLPVAAGPLVLLYPEWVAGAHSPINTVDHLAGLVISVGGKRLEWRRDAVETHAFHVDVPAGVASLDIRFDLLTPTDAKQGRITIVDDIAHLQWQSLVLYPAGYFARDIEVGATLTLPAGWQAATALDVARAAAATTEFKRTDLETLGDSPVMAGRYVRRIVLDTGPRPVRLDLLAESPEQLAATEAQLAPHAALVVQADRLFGGARHFDHYDILVGLSDTLGRIGREHHRSTEIVLRPDYFTGWDRTAAGRSTIAHEYVHSWNGKFRRGADSWTADFNTPIRNSLLWVYEGQTTYWGNVLAARSGLTTAAEARDVLAMTAAAYADPPGRSWKTLADTTNDPQVALRRPQPWASYQRSEDYYGEGSLVWLDADTLIRERSGGAKSLDDFAKAFFGGDDGVWLTKTYRFEDVVAGLNAVLPYDWATFLKTRLETHDAAPLDGLARGGYRLAWSSTQSDYAKGADAVAKRTDLTWSLGFVVDTKDATLSAVQWDGPAFKSGLTVGTQLIAVDGQPYTAELLVAAIRASAGRGPPVALIVKSGGHLGTVAVDWHGGLRYPRLERIPGTPARLDAIFAAKGPS
ncbi:peptidase M61 [Sphingosinicellaceae bacterium]|nr:peptidase M61 [Sphingosinicellaceae bacterium]